MSKPKKAPRCLKDYKLQIKSGHLSFNESVLMATWDSSQWWVFNVVWDWKVLYNAGVKSLLKIYTDRNQPQGVDMRSLA